MMYGSFMDESVDKGKAGLFAVGGILGLGVPIFELERRWGKLLNDPTINVPYFKASDCNSGAGPFSKFVVDPANITTPERQKLDSISQRFVELITHPVAYDSRQFLCVQGTAVLQPDFYDVIKDPKARSVLGPSPYRLAYDLAMIQCAWTMKELGDGEPKHCVSFICDRDQEHSPFAEEAYNSLKKTNINAAEYMGMFSSEDEKQSLAIQAADLAVFEIRRALNLSLKNWSGDLRKQFNALADDKIVFLVTHTKHEQLDWIVKNHNPGEPFKLDELMDLQLGDNIDQLRTPPA